MILSCSNIKKDFGEITVINSCSFSIDDLDHIAIVGVNGAGKTTLLKIIMGITDPTSGSVSINKDKSIGYLSQKNPVDSKNTLYNEFLSAKQDLINIEKKLRSYEEKMPLLSGDKLEECMDEYSSLSTTFELQGGYSYLSEITGVLNGLGFHSEDYDRSISSFSGGQKTRVALGKILLQKPNLIILDEPTNHLDLQSISWLENYLLNYHGALLVVSHDRFFLDKITTKILEIEQTNTRLFTGNYSAYAKKKELIREAKLHEYMNNKKERKRQEEIIDKLRSFNREKSIKRAESREKVLEKMEHIDRPLETRDSFHMTLSPRLLSGKDVLSINELSKSFDSMDLFQNISFEIKRGEHVALLGDNGTGKTTLLKILNKQIPASKGTFHLGTNVEVGYYDQEQQLLSDDATLFNEIADAYPNLTITEIRNTLAAFSFTGDDVTKQVKSLSGGERGRLSLAKLMLSNANFIILDEPTNHLDIRSKEILETALNGYDGTILFVSHDRYFISKTATRVLELSQNKITNYTGDYTFYLDQKKMKEEQETQSSISSSTNKNDTKEKLDWTKSKEESARIRKITKQIEQAENKIEELELKKEELEQQMAEPINCSNSSKLQELTEKLNECTISLEDTMDLWSSLQEEL